MDPVGFELGVYWEYRNDFNWTNLVAASALSGVSRLRRNRSVLNSSTSSENKRKLFCGWSMPVMYYHVSYNIFYLYTEYWEDPSNNSGKNTCGSVGS